jgi:MFS family permease
MALIRAVTGISGILGVGALTWVLLRPRWRPWAWRTFIMLAVVLVVGSLLGFLFFNQWQVDLARHTPHMDTRRLSLVWAPRLLSGELGRQFWAHANTAAFLFAVAWVVLADALFRRPKHAASGWVLSLLLATAVFLTASRSAWMMVVLALPALLAFRTWRYALQVGAVLALAGMLGIAAVSQQPKPAPGNAAAPPSDLSASIHLGQLAERGSIQYKGTQLATQLKVSGVEVFSAGDLNSDDSCEDLVIQDAKRGIYKRLILKNNHVQGAVLYGDARDGSWYAELISEQTDISSIRNRLLFGRDFALKQAG